MVGHHIMINVWLADDNHRSLQEPQIVYLDAVISQGSEPLGIKGVKLDRVYLAFIDILVLMLKVSLILSRITHLHIGIGAIQEFIPAVSEPTKGIHVFIDLREGMLGFKNQLRALLMLKSADNWCFICENSLHALVNYVVVWVLASTDVPYKEGWLVLGLNLLITSGKDILLMVVPSESIALSRVLIHAASEKLLFNTTLIDHFATRVYSEMLCMQLLMIHIDQWYLSFLVSHSDAKLIFHPGPLKCLGLLDLFFKMIGLYILPQQLF